MAWQKESKKWTDRRLLAAGARERGRRAPLLLDAAGERLQGGRRREEAISCRWSTECGRAGSRLELGVEIANPLQELLQVVDCITKD